MTTISPINGGWFGASTGASINLRSQHGLTPTPSPVPQQSVVSDFTALLQISELRKAIEAFKPSQSSIGISAGTLTQAAVVSSSQEIDFFSNETTTYTGDEINTSPTSYQLDGDWTAQTQTAPWTLNSTADATVSGTYDGTGGVGTFEFRVIQGGTLGVDDTTIRVFNPNGSTLQDVSISRNDPIGTNYNLSNGMTFSLNEGTLELNDSFEVHTTAQTSFTPTSPTWQGGTAPPTIGGFYGGAQTGDLTFKVEKGGIHGTDNLRLAVYDTNGTQTDTINIGKNDPANQTYVISNGLTLQLGAGNVIENETFNVSVTAGTPLDYTNNPEWNYSSSLPTLSGVYDGTNGTQSLSMKVEVGGVRGQDDLVIGLYDEQGAKINDVNVGALDAIDQKYDLGNGMEIQFSAGELIKDETFSFDVEVDASYTTDPNPVESTAQVDITGSYNGAHLTDALKIVATSEGNRGSEDLTFDVFTSNGTFIESVNVSASDPVSQTYTLSSGLEFGLTNGFVALNESMTLNVNHTVPTTVDPDRTFDAVGAGRVQLDAGQAVGAGSFEINGNEIQVLASDSISTVLNRINSAGIDITASFNAGTDKITLTRDSSGSQHDIIVGNDTSGFLAATKLDQGTTVQNHGDANSLLRDLSGMNSVTNGSLTVNGVSIAFDKDNDSLSDLLTRIEQQADVTTHFDSQTNKITITSSKGTDLDLQDNGTGFFDAIHIQEGVTEGVKGAQQNKRGYTAVSRRSTIRAMANFSEKMNQLFEDAAAGGHAAISAIRAGLQSEFLADHGNESRRIKTSFGIQLDFGSSEKVFNFNAGVKRQFAKELASHEGASGFEKFMFGTNRSQKSLHEKILNVVEFAERQLQQEMDASKYQVDVLV